MRHLFNAKVLLGAVVAFEAHRAYSALKSALTSGLNASLEVYAYGTSGASQGRTLALFTDLNLIWINFDAVACDYLLTDDIALENDLGNNSENKLMVRTHNLEQRRRPNGWKFQLCFRHTTMAEVASPEKPSRECSWYSGNPMPPRKHRRWQRP